MNAIKDSIKSGRTVVGTTAGPNVDVSILADAGYDFLLFDTQHSAWEIKQLQPSICRCWSDRRRPGVGAACWDQASRTPLDWHITCRIIQEPDDWRGEMPNPIVPWSKKPISKLSGTGSCTFGRHAPPQPSLRSPSAM